MSLHKYFCTIININLFTLPIYYCTIDNNIFFYFYEIRNYLIDNSFKWKLLIATVISIFLFVANMVAQLILLSEFHLRNSMNGRVITLDPVGILFFFLNKCGDNQTKNSFKQFYLTLSFVYYYFVLFLLFYFIQYWIIYKSIVHRFITKNELGFKPYLFFLKNFPVIQ